MAKTVVEIKGLYKKYDNLVAVNHMDLEIKEGEVFGFLGPNGSGKSTTIHCILGLIKYQEGTIKVFGKTMQEAEKEIKRNIGVIMQDIAVFDELTVYENIAYFCSLYIEDRLRVKQYTEEAIKFVALGYYSPPFLF